MANKIVIKKSSVAGKVPVPADLDVGELGVNVTDKKLYTKDSTGVIVELIGGGGGGDVTGPASSTDNALTRFDGITGKVIQASIVSLDDDGNLANVNGLAFDTTPTNPPTAIGGMYWNAGDGTPAVILDNDVTLNIGQENLVKVFNNSASTITKGQVVAVNGAQGQRPAVVLADADSEPLSAATLGIADEDIAAGAEGFASTFGVIRGIDTSGFTAGQPVYLSQTAGAYTATRPAAPAHTVFLGWIIKVNASSGEIFLNINNGWELDELHNVLISSPVNGNTLIYDQAVGVWKNASITAGTGISVTNGAGSISVANAGVTSFSGGTTGLTPATGTTGNITLAGTLGVGNGGTGLTSYTLNGVVYASGTGTLATGSALTFDGTNLINTGAYTAPSNVAGAGTKTTIRGSTGTGQAGTSGGNGFIELVGGGGTSTWTAFAVPLTARRRGGINLQAGTAQADAGGTYVSGSNIDILGSAGTNNGTSVGVGSRIVIQSGSVTKTDGQLNFGSSIVLGSSTSTSGSPVSISSGSFITASGSNNGSSVTVAAGAATTGGSITLFPGNATVSGSTVGKAYVRDPATATDYEILTTGNITTTAITAATANSVPYFNGSKVLTTGSALTFDGTNLGIGTSTPVKELDVAGSINLTGTIYGTEFSGIYFSGVDNFNAGISSANSGNDLVFQANSSEQMRLTSTGLGIGTSSPSGYGNTSKLVIQTTSSTNGVVATFANSGSTGAAIQFFQNGIDTATIGMPAGLQGITFAPSGTTERARIDSSGNLLVGTTSSDGSRLRVYGSYQTLGDGAYEGLIGKASSLVSGGGSGDFAIRSAANMVFATNGNTERARIDSSGNLMVGATSSLGGRMSVDGSATDYGVFYVRSSLVADTSKPGALFQKYANDTTTSQVLLRFLVNNGNTTQGQINANGANAAAFGSYSDARLKENIVSIAPQLANIMALRPVEFDYIESEGGGHQTGFVAQEMEAVYPDAVGEREDGMKTITGWSKTEARLVKALQELNAKVQTLEAQLKGA